MPSDAQKLFAGRLKARVVELGLSDAEAARKTGVPVKNFNNYTLGLRVPDPDTIIKICDGLGITPNYLFGRSHPGNYAIDDSTQNLGDMGHKNDQNGSARDNPQGREDNGSMVPDTDFILTMYKKMAPAAKRVWIDAGLDLIRRGDDQSLVPFKKGA